MKHFLTVILAIGTFCGTAGNAFATMNAYLKIEGIPDGVIFTNETMSGVKDLTDATDIAHGQPSGKRRWNAVVFAATTSQVDALLDAFDHQDKLSSIVLSFSDGIQVHALTYTFQNAVIYALDKIPSAHGELEEVSFSYSQVHMTGPALSVDTWTDPTAGLASWAAEPIKTGPESSASN